MFRANLGYKLYTESKLNNFDDDKIDNGTKSIPTVWDINKDKYFFKPNVTNDSPKEPCDPCAFQTRRHRNCGSFCKVLWH